jgi:hypothetical protein
MSSQDDTSLKSTQNKPLPLRNALSLLRRHKRDRNQKQEPIHSFDRELLLRIIRERFSLTGTDRA